MWTRAGRTTTAKTRLNEAASPPKTRDTDCKNFPRDGSRAPFVECDCTSCVQKSRSVYVFNFTPGLTPYDQGLQDRVRTILRRFGTIEIVKVPSSPGKNRLNPPKGLIVRYVWLFGPPGPRILTPGFPVKI